MLKHCCIAVAATVLAGLSAVCSAENQIAEHTPFDSYVRVAEKIFVYDGSQFSRYSGPDVSHWERIYSEEPDEPAYDRKRLGIISIAPMQKAYLDVMQDPMVEHYEFRDVKSGNVIFRLSYYGGFHGALLFNGQSSIYIFATPASLCTQGKEIRKYMLVNGKLNEVKQPLVYWENVNSKLSLDSTILLAPNKTSQPVATLPKGSTAQVLTKEKDWFLIKTPLGLTGWVPAERQATPLTDLYNCN